MSSAHPDRKQKATHELKELLMIFSYLAFFFCALTTYSMLLLNEYHVKYWNYAFALINALVITKVIMIGEYAKVGKKYFIPLFVFREFRRVMGEEEFKAMVFGKKTPGKAEVAGSN